jgi:copper resistance protein B
VSRLAFLCVLLTLPVARVAAQHEDHASGPRHEDHAPAGQHDDHATAAQHEDHASAEQHEEHASAEQHEEHASAAPRDGALTGSSPPNALSGPEHAADAIFGAEAMAAARELLRIESGAVRTQSVLADRFEMRGAGEGEDEAYLWDLQGWHGGDVHKLWWKSEGGGALGGNPRDAELQVLYSRAVTPFFDMQLGFRRDFRPSPQRSHAVIGVQGLLPYVFEIDAAAFLSEDGDLSGRFEAEYDVRILQRLVLQPRVELNFSAQSIPELGIGSGLGSVESGLRLRYEVRREIAPYLGIAWERKRGRTADRARAAGGDTRSREIIVGVRAWF